MMLSIALTQFVFISLGILSVNVLLKAGGSDILTFGRRAPLSRKRNEPN
jgi:hypothetical protein